MIREPIFIIGAPRSGTSILFRCLGMHPALWHLPRESHGVFEGPFHPQRGFESNRVTEADVTAEHAIEICTGFADRVLNLGVLGVDQAKWVTDRSLRERLRNRLAMRYFGVRSRRRLRVPFRLLEKTPKNSLRVSALHAIFPDARFVYLTRDARQNIDSLLAGWRAVDQFGPVRRHRFCGAGYPITDGLQLQDYDGPRWKFALIPGWKALQGRTVADVAAAQYFECNEIAAADLSRVHDDRVLRLEFSHFIADPVESLRRIFRWADLPGDTAAEAFAEGLPRVNDATPHLQRKANELRYPDEVDRAIADRRQRAA